MVGSSSEPEDGWSFDREAFDHVSFLVRSENRTAVLAALTRGSHSRQTLQQQADISRPTLARILGAFEERGWVKRSGHTYSATSLGRLVFEQLAGVLEGTAAVTRLEQIIEVIPEEELPADPSVFSEATLTVAEPGSPSRPVRRLATLVEDSSMAAELLPLPPGRPSCEILFEHLAGGGTASVVACPVVISQLGSALETDMESGRSFATDRLTVRAHESVPFRLTILDERVAITTYDRTTGVVTAVCDTAEAAAHQWAADIFERYASASEPRPLPTKARPTISTN